MAKKARRSACRRRRNQVAIGPSGRWEKVEEQLRAILQQTADDLAQQGRISPIERAKYFLSLTEQEIVCGLEQPRGSQATNYGQQGIAWIRRSASPGVRSPASRTFLGRLWGASLDDQALRQNQHELRVEPLKARIERALPRDCIISAQATQDAVGQFDEVPSDFLCIPST